jgi:hypothetical protein
MAGKNLFRFDSNEKQKKFFKASLIFLVAAFIGAIIYSTIYLIVNADKTATIEILVGPTDAIVEIDGRNFPTEGTIRIEPGTYAVKIEKEGFISYNGSIKATANETSYVYEFLNEVDENGTFYNNERELARIQQISDKRADLFHEQYNGTDPIWDVTPYDDYPSGYKIYAEKDDEGKIIVNIYLYTCSKDRISKLKQNALDYFEEKKINLENYTLNYLSCQ